MKKIIYGLLILIALTFCINVNAEVSVERSFPYTDGSLDLIFNGIEISDEHTYEWAIEKLSSTEPTTYFEVLNPDYENKEIKISLLSTNEDVLNVIKSTNTAYITIKDNEGTIVLDSHKVDLTLAPLHAFEINKAGTYGGAPSNAAYEIKSIYNINGENYHYLFDKITDKDIINNYVDNNRDISGLNLKGYNDKPSSSDSRWKNTEYIFGSIKIRNEYLPTETGLYYLWVKANDTDVKDVYGYTVVEIGTVEKIVDNTNNNNNNTTDKEEDTNTTTDNKKEESDTINNKYDNHTYNIIEKQLTWKEAKAYCEKNDGYLVTITSDEEQKFIDNYIKEKGLSSYRFWIGAYSSSNKWKWITGETFDYTNWGEGQPDEKDQSYANTHGYETKYNGKLTKIGQWDNIENEGDSDKNIYFICENGKVNVETAKDQPLKDSPETGVKTYIVLSILTLIGLSGTLYILKKKNLIKNI